MKKVKKGKTVGKREKGEKKEKGKTKRKKGKRKKEVMQRIVCPDTESWTMVERLISVDVERLGNVQWWSLVSQYAIFLTQDGVKRGTRIARMMEHERWDRVFSATCVGVLWQLRPDQRNLLRPVVPEAEAEQGVAPVIAMPVVPRVDRRRYVTKRDLVKYGYTDERQACTQCRDRIGELMAGDDDQRQVERMMSRTTVDVENEITCPETGEEVDVGEPSVQPRSVD